MIVYTVGVSAAGHRLVSGLWRSRPTRTAVGALLAAPVGPRVDEVWKVSTLRFG